MSHAPQTSINFHQAGPDMEPTKKKRSSREYVAKGSPDRHKDDRYTEATRSKGIII